MMADPSELDAFEKRWRNELEGVLLDARCAASAVLQINPIEGALGLADAMLRAELICDPSGLNPRVRLLARAAVARAARDVESWCRGACRSTIDEWMAP